MTKRKRMCSHSLIIMWSSAQLQTFSHLHDKGDLIRRALLCQTRHEVHRVPVGIQRWKLQLPPCEGLWNERWMLAVKPRVEGHSRQADMQ